MKKITPSEIGYYGKPIDSLSREELLDALIELVTRVHECASENNVCRSIISIKE